MRSYTHESTRVQLRVLRIAAVFVLGAMCTTGVAAESPAYRGEPASLAKSTSAIGPGFTGAWYDPQQSGHGLFLEVLPQDKLLAWWFTFTPDGTQQSWFGGVGTISGNTATVPVALTTGGRWIPDFDITKVVNNPWGTLAFTFTDCNSGQVDFTSNYPGYGSNHMTLTRLTEPAGLTCANAAVAGAEGLWSGKTSLAQTVRAIILDDGTYYILYSRPGNAIDAGVVQGWFGAAGGQLTSSNGQDFPVANAAETNAFAKPAEVSGAYVPRSSLQLTIVESTGTRTLSASYDPGYERPASLAAAAGTYTGYTGHSAGKIPAVFTLDARGTFSGGNAACSFAGTATPRQSVNVFDFTARSAGDCIFGAGPIFGVLYYDDAARQVHGFAPFDSRSDQWYLIGSK
jgi:hypothetical protein